MPYVCVHMCAYIYECVWLTQALSNDFLPTISSSIISEDNVNKGPKRKMALRGEKG